MSKIFISYRREDTAPYAGRLCDKLREYFGKDNVFMDIDTIRPGVDFVDELAGAIGSCDAFISVIGDQWLSITDESGNRRLDNKNDYIRMETASALSRNILVIPVLVEGANMPKAEDLPEDLKQLARRQAHELSDKRWDYDTKQLISALGNAGIKPIDKRLELTGRPSVQETIQAKKLSAKAIASLILLLLVIIVFFTEGKFDNNLLIGEIIFSLVALFLAISAFYDTKLNKAKGRVLAIVEIVFSLIMLLALFGEFNEEGRGPSQLSKESASESATVSALPLTSQSPTSVRSTPATPQTFAPQPPLPLNTCPLVQGMYWMQFPNTWYGPFAGGDGISFSNTGGFYVWDADMLNDSGTYGVIIPYPDPNSQIQRNVWVPLQQSRFSVCVDSSGNVFALQK